MHKIVNWYVLKLAFHDADTDTNTDTVTDFLTKILARKSRVSDVYHRRRSRASPVLTAISLVNGKPWEPSFLTPHKIDIP